MVHVWVAGKTVWSHCYTRVICERFINSCVYFYFIYLWTQLLQQSVQIENPDQVVIGECDSNDYLFAILQA